MYNRYQGNTGRVLRVSDEPGSPAVGQTVLPGPAIALLSPVRRSPLMLT